MSKNHSVLLPRYYVREAAALARWARDLAYRPTLLAPFSQDVLHSFGDEWMSLAGFLADQISLDLDEIPLLDDVLRTAQIDAEAELAHYPDAPPAVDLDA